MSSAKFKEVEKAAAPFFHDVRDFVFGRPTTLENMVRPSVSAVVNITYTHAFSVQREQTALISNLPPAYLPFFQLWDYMNTELVHNITYAHRLPPTFIEQARGLANFRENAIFSDEHMAGIGNSCVLLLPLS